MGLNPINVNRDPYPFPKFEGDIQFRGDGARGKRRPRSSTVEAQLKVPLSTANFGREIKFYFRSHGIGCLKRLH